MALENNKPPAPTWRAPFAVIGTQVENAIGTGTYTVDGTANADARANGLLVQAHGAAVYFRLDGNPATANSFALVADDPPLIIPYIPGTTIVRFLGSAANAVLTVALIQVH